MRSRLLTEPVSIQKINGSTDEYGNTIPHANGSAVSTVGYLEQKESVETLNDRDTVVSSWTAWLPAGTDVNAFDRLNFSGQVFEVDGAPWLVWNPRKAAQSHIECKLKVVI
jgi:head-tail adaptor